jgi:protein-disulfide isomerase
VVKPPLVSEYVESGAVRFEFRDAPIVSPLSPRVAEAAACAADQGAYWRYHDTVFLNQAPANFTDDRLKAMAETVGLDMAAFNRCLDSGAKRAEVEQSAAEARQEGITSTPSVFINGTKIEEWYSWESVQQAIDAELAEA